MSHRLISAAAFLCVFGIALDVQADQSDLAACHRLGELYFTVQERILLRQTPDKIVEAMSRGNPSLANIVHTVAVDLAESKPKEIIPFVALRAETCVSEAGAHANKEVLVGCYTEVLQSRLIFQLKTAGRPVSEVKETALGLIERLKPDSPEKTRASLTNLIDAAYETSEDRMTFMRSRFAKCVSNK